MLGRVPWGAFQCGRVEGDFRYIEAHQGIAYLDQPRGIRPKCADLCTAEEATDIQADVRLRLVIGLDFNADVFLAFVSPGSGGTDGKRGGSSGRGN